MKRRKILAEVVCEKKLKRKVIDGLKLLILKAKGLTTPTAKMLSFHISFSYYLLFFFFFFSLKSLVGGIKE